MTKLEYARNIMRVAGLGTALVTTSAGLAFAQSASFSGSNDTTGANSENHNNYSVDSRSDYNLRNSADANNRLNGFINTGFNTTSRNTTAGDVGSGSADVSADISNDLNTSGASGMVVGSAGDADADFTNGTTGDHSRNVNTVDINNRTNVNVRNSADIDNNANLFINTGRNTVSRNTSVGNVNGGDVDASISYSNTANTGGSSSFNLGGSSSSADVSGGNSQTGADSINRNTVNVDNRTDASLSNQANLNNNFNINANTGGNNVSRNTTAGDVNSGNVSLDFSVSNTAN